MTHALGSRALAWRSRRAGLRHPWIAGISRGRATPGPNAVVLLERTFARLDGLGLGMDDMLDLSATVDSFVAGFVQYELADRDERRRTGLTEQQWRHTVAPYLLSLVEDGRNPFLKRVIVESEAYPDADAVFERRLGYVLDGLAAGLDLP